jgi:RNA polymerase sigma-70 factor (ECF subfamily)
MPTEDQAETPARDDPLGALMRRAQDGDARAYTDLLHELSGLLRGHITKHYPTLRDVEDVVQEALVTVHKARHTYNPDRPFIPWLLAIARHRALDHLRKRKRISSREIADETVLNLQTAPDPDASATESDEAARALLERLSDKEREVITLLKIDGFSVNDVAKRTGYSASNVKVIASRGYAKLRRHGKPDG